MRQISALVLVAVAGCGGEPRPEHDDFAAYYMCKEFVTDRLRAPSTAEFGGFNDSRVSLVGDAKYTVSGHLDAHNAFGAMIRNRYDCTVQYEGSSRWTLDDLEMR
jgi:hypothetical protein